jgi:hypothetical protein
VKEVVKQVVKNCLTGPDNETYDIGKILWLKGVLSYIALGLWQGLWKDHMVSLVDYATGFAALLGGGGLGQMLKRQSEQLPEPPPKAPPPPRGHR